MRESNQYLSYRVYLLRCWVDDSTPDGRQIWRFSLESIEENRRHGFTSLEALGNYIASQIEPKENNS